MCANHIHTNQLTLNAELSYDPTRTTTLRNAFAREMRKRFRKLRGLIRKAVVEDDVFGLRAPTVMQSPGRRAYAFDTSADKVEKFMRWLNGEVNKGVLEITTIERVGQSANQAWANLYIKDSYKRGVQRARYEMKSLGTTLPTIEESGGIEAVMQQPFHVDRLGLMYTRTFNDLKGITDAMDNQISRVLTQGMADGDGAALLARKMNSVITGGGADLGITDTLGRFIPAERRAVILARTEIVRTHHMAMIQEYENYAVEGVEVQAEHATAGDSRVCPQCADLEGTVYTLKEARNMIPVHPQCRCIALPKRVVDTASTGWNDLQAVREGQLPRLERGRFVR
jgi:SPP1 gp7 family putative phage head morphogenesis protein